MELLSLYIDGTEVQVPKGTTVLDAAHSFDISIPTLCHLPGMKPFGRCRMCVVEVEGHEHLLPSCLLQAEDGMVVTTRNRKVMQSRRMSLELLIAQHPMHCLTCYRNGKCQLQDLAKEFGIQQACFSRRTAERKDGNPVYPPLPLDEKSPAITHDPNMCIACGLCVEACRSLQQVDVIDFAYRGCQRRIEPAFGQSLNDVECIACGQCIQVCPVNAFYEKPEKNRVQTALRDPELHVVALLSPMVGVSIGEEFGLEPGTELTQQMIATLKTAGFDKVFDVGVGGDLIVLEEAYQLLTRVKSGKRLPLFSSSSPAWIKYIEHFYPNLLPLLSPCKSPVQALASLVKTYYAQQQDISAERIFVVSITPCTAEKFERNRPEMTVNGNISIDACLTTKEVASLIRGITGHALLSVDAQPFDPPFAEASGAGSIICAAGGMLEGVMRTFYELFTEKKLKSPEFLTMRESEGFKEISLKLGKHTISAVLVHGTGNVGRLLENIAQEKKQYHYVEIKGCPEGCARGGGAPLPSDDETVRARSQALYTLDAGKTIRKAHENPAIKKIYDEFLKKPAGPDVKKLLYTTYTQRQRYL